MSTPARSRWSPLWRAIAALGIASLVAVSLRAHADSSVLHEFIPPDPSEDVSFSATTIEGDLPAAIQTPSGVATAPDPRRMPSENHAYSGATTDDSPDATYQPDRDTRRPKVENYDDPFSPATAPFKRLRAYDLVNADYSLGVYDKTLRSIAPGGALGAGDEPFYGDMSIDLLPNEPVRIPTVGPGARILRMHANPEESVLVLHDGADNWFARGGARRRVRLVLELAIPRATFGSDFADVDWNEIGRFVPPQPASHEAAVTEVAQTIGVTRAMRPRDALKKLVGYFQSFTPSEDRPTGHADIFLDLALSKKGVCRHQSFAFLVTALGLGIPTRMVVNEAHAWVEVFDASLWHRIDLGGAAANLDVQDADQRPSYTPPPDPYGWPEQRDSGQDLVDRSRAQSSGASGGATPTEGDGGTSTAPSPSATAPRDPNLEPAEISVTAIDSDARRGLPLHIQGAITSGGAPCPHLRVDVMLTSAAMKQGAAIGSLSTDERGAYDGAVVIPRDFALGDYELLVLTPGDARCGPGRTK